MYDRSHMVIVKVFHGMMHLRTRVLSVIVRSGGSGSKSKCPNFWPNFKRYPGPQMLCSFSEFKG